MRLHDDTVSPRRLLRSARNSDVVMFDLSFVEILFIAVLSVLVLGPVWERASALESGPVSGRGSGRELVVSERASARV